MKNSSNNSESAFFSYIGNEKAGYQLIDFLSKRFKYFDKAGWLKRIEDKDVLINGHIMPPETILNQGDKVSYVAKSRPEPRVEKKMSRIHEDDDILVINKPAHTPMHPSGRYLRNSLINILKRRYPKEQFLALAHRLDRETSGVCFLTKSQRAKKSLYWQFFNHEVQKKYLALCWGTPPQKQGIIDAPIGDSTPETSKIRVKKIVNGQKPKTAQTRYKVLEIYHFNHPFTNNNIPKWPHLTHPDYPETFPLVSLIECQPITGRTNQIRVHMAHLGCGLIGDKLYHPDEQVFLEYRAQKPLLDEDPSEKKTYRQIVNFPKKFEKQLLLDAHALHSYEATIKHPKNQKLTTYTSPPPRTWKKLLKDSLLLEKFD